MYERFCEVQAFCYGSEPNWLGWLVIYILAGVLYLAVTTKLAQLVERIWYEDEHGICEIGDLWFVQLFLERSSLTAILVFHSILYWPAYFLRLTIIIVGAVLWMTIEPVFGDKNSRRVRREEYCRSRGRPSPWDEMEARDRAEK